MLRDAKPIGVCRSCGVTFAAAAAHSPGPVAMLLRVHESICPGGARHGETVVPLAILQKRTPTGRERAK